MYLVWLIYIAMYICSLNLGFQETLFTFHSHSTFCYTPFTPPLPYREALPIYSETLRIYCEFQGAAHHTI